MKNQKSEDVVISKLPNKIEQNMDLLIGNNKFNKDIYLPFDKRIIEFFDDLSKIILSNNKYKNSEVISFGFWCRKNNIYNYSKDFDFNDLRVGRGISFHVTPSNVPLNFCYSMAFGLLSGNTCMIKISNKNFTEVNIMINYLNKILRKKKFHFLKSVIKIFRTKKNESLITEYLSSISDLRLIWGGNNTINLFKKMNTKINTQDIFFRDRYSISVLNADKIIKINNDDFKKLVNNFYNDTMIYDQNACTAPHIIYWFGSNIKSARNKFWNKFSLLVNNKYKLDLFQVYDKYKIINEYLVNEPYAERVDVHNKTIYTIQLKKIPKEVQSFRGRWGVFLEVNSRSINKLKSIIDENLQTVTYFGFKKEIFDKYLRSNKINGIDRIVPVGQSLNMSLKWDGYDLMKILTRYVEIK